MSQRVRPELRFETISDVIADVRLMQRVGYEKHGCWSLPQICWHLSRVMEPTLTAPTTLTVTPEQSARWNQFIEVIRKPGGASQFPAGPSVTPSGRHTDDDVDAFVELLLRLKNFPHSHAQAGPLGAVPIEQVQEAHRLHAAHHLGFLKPYAQRRVGLRYAGVDDAIQDVRNLQRGCIQIGNWTLPQACWHVKAVTQSRLRPPPFPPDNDEQKTRASLLTQLLTTGRLPKIVAPIHLEPPIDASDDEIAEVISTFERVKTYQGFSPHRIFGTMSDDDSRQMILIHAAHHFSYLVPVEPTR